MLFSADAIPAIHGYAGGVPRLINTVCDNCLFEAFLQKMKGVTLKIVHSVAGDLGLLQQPLSGSAPERAKDELDDIESMLDRLEQKA